MNELHRRSPLDPLRGLLALSALLIAVALGACGDDPKPPPTADLRFFHASETLGNVEVTVGTRKFLLSPDKLSQVVKIPPGFANVRVANAGAQAALIEEQITVDEGPHVFVIAGDQTDSTLGFFEVGGDSPALQPGQAAFQVFSVVSADLALDVYGPSSTEPDEVGRYAQSSFIVTTPELASLRVYNAGNDPNASVALINLNASALGLRSGGAYLVILSGNLSGLNHTITRLY